MRQFAVSIFWQSGDNVSHAIDIPVAYHVRKKALLQINAHHVLAATVLLEVVCRAQRVGLCGHHSWMNFP